MHVNQASSIFHLVKKVCVQIDDSFPFSKSKLCSFSECKCNPDGSKTLECGKINGNCSCKEGFTGLKCDECIPNVIGDKCDTCEETFFNYPACQGLPISRFLKKSIYSSFSDCECNPEGSIGLECDSNGECSCREGYTGIKCHECLPNVVGDYCDKCQPKYFNYPSCKEGCPSSSTVYFGTFNVLFYFRV